MKKIKIFHNKYYKLLVMSGVLWGFSPLIYKNSLLFFGFVSLLAIRFLVGAGIVYALSFRKFIKISKRHLVLIIIMSLTSSVASMFLYLSGLKLTSAMHASIIGLSLPFFVYLLSVLILKEKVHRVVLIGSVLASAGLLVIIFGSNTNNGQASIAGDVLILLSEVFFSIGVILARKIVTGTKKLPPEQLAFADYLLAGIVFAVAAFIVGNGSSMPTFTPIAILWLLLVVTVGGFLPNILFLKSARRLPAEKLADTNFITPIVGIMLAVIFLNESMNVSFLIGGTLVFLGLTISNKKLTPRLPVLTEEVKAIELAFIHKSQALERIIYNQYK
ncbi:MAG TPA: DMT family transporter [Candidatus Saccharibacteria bacterium]|nr:DMT family transporter [Candidatus Saccharibacteria bacterium]